MSVKNILINLNDVDNVDATIKTSCALARRYDAHLIGIFVVPLYPLKMGVFGSDSIMLDLQNSELTKYKQHAKETVEIFEKALRANDVLGKSLVLNSTDSDIADEFIRHARTTDLILVPNIDAENFYGVEVDFVEKIILESGRPVIIIPRGQVFETIGDRVNIAWNMSAEAARASFDTLPLLTSQSEIRFVWVDPHLNPKLAGNLPGSEIAEVFSHHGLSVIADTVASDGRNIGETLLHEAAINAADLLVMGAYGHSRLREFIFGGATRHILANLNLPILMSR